jgi:hypothetical protein
VHQKLVNFILIITFSFVNLNLFADENSKDIESEPSIYLPFPDFAEKEVKEPTLEETKQNSPLLDAGKLVNSGRIIPDVLPSIKKADSQKVTTSTSKKSIESKPPNKNKDGKPSKSIDSSLKKENSISNTKNSIKTNLPKTDIIEKNSTESDDKELEFDPQEYKKSLEKIRQIEKADASKAILEYKSLLTKYFSNKIQAEINLSIAWNYFHRNKYSESLEHVLAILDEPKNLDLSEYPTSLFLAGRIHEQNWNGSNRDFAIKYYEKFLFHLKSNQENFTKSYYIPKVKERFKILQLGNEI